MIEVKNTLNGELNASVVKEYPELEEVTVTPTLDGQELKPNKYGYSKIKVEGIPATDITITPTTKEQKQEGIFKAVTIKAIEGQELNLNPSEEQQNYEGVFLGVNINPIQVEEITTDLDFSSSNAIELTAQEGAYIKKATINKDANLTPENIKSGVSILGVSGDVADTSDADATSNDIIAGKTAYVGNEKIAGTYIPLDTSDATATAEDIVKDKIAYVNGEKIVGTASKGFDTSQIVNCAQMFLNNTNISDLSGLDTTNATTTASMCMGCTSLEIVPELDTSKSTDMSRMFSGCSSLKNLPFLDASSATTLAYYASTCPSLTDESLNNVMLTCISAITITTSAAKSLKRIGLTSEQATICKSLSNYQAFLDAGWVTGY